MGSLLPHPPEQEFLVDFYHLPLQRFCPTAAQLAPSDIILSLCSLPLSQHQHLFQARSYQQDPSYLADLCRQTLIFESVIDLVSCFRFIVQDKVVPFTHDMHVALKALSLVESHGSTLHNRWRGPALLHHPFHLLMSLQLTRTVAGHNHPESQEPHASSGGNRLWIWKGPGRKQHWIP